MSWFNESLHSKWRDQGYSQRFKVDKILHKVKSEHHQLMIFETPYFGRVLALDGIVQTTENDEYAYHEMLAHVPILAHGKVNSVLIIGGGDGGVLKEVLHHQQVDSVTMVEIDQDVVELCKEYLPTISDGAFDSPKTNLVIGDGCSYVVDTKDRYDVIIIDSTDPMGPAEGLFAEDFYKNCQSRLKENGILVNQNGVPFFQEQEISNSYQRLKRVFKDTTFYLTVVPTYIGGYMALGWASDFSIHRSISPIVLESRYKEVGLTTRYYSPYIHKAAFVLPPFIKEIIT